MWTGRNVYLYVYIMQSLVSQKTCFHFMDVLQAVEELTKVDGVSKILVAENDAYGGFLAGILL